MKRTAAIILLLVGLPVASSIGLATDTFTAKSFAASLKPCGLAVITVENRSAETIYFCYTLHDNVCRHAPAVPSGESREITAYLERGKKVIEVKIRDSKMIERISLRKEKTVGAGHNYFDFVYPADK